MDSWDPSTADNWEREAGRFKLPAEEFVELRKKVLAAAKERRSAVSSAARKFRRGLTELQRDEPLEFRDAADEFLDQVAQDDVGLSRELRSKLLGDLEEIQKAHGESWPAPKTRRWPWQPELSDVEVGRLGRIHFDDRSSTVQWEVDGTVGAADEAHDHPVGAALLDGLSEVRWDKHTGGSLWADDSERVAARVDHGLPEGGKYPTYSIGPQGEAEAHSVCVDYIDPQGFRRRGLQVRTKELQGVSFRDMDAARREEGQRVRNVARFRGPALSRQGQQGRVQRGVPAGGQFTAQAHDESDLDLDGKL